MNNKIQHRRIYQQKKFNIVEVALYHVSFVL